MNGILILCFTISCICGFSCIPFILKYCEKHDLYDIPDKRKVHKNKIPRLGGVCFLPSLILSYSGALLAMYYMLGKEGTSSFSLSSIMFIIGLVIVYITGFVDDMIGLSAKTKFQAQALAAMLLPASGFYIDNLYGVCGIHEIPFWAGAALTVFIIMFINNAINLIDGIDGLSSGLSLIALLGYFILYRNINLFNECIIAIGLIGVLIPFIRYNLFKKNDSGKKIFMGDSGSLTLGFILSYLLINYIIRGSAQHSGTECIIYSCSLAIIPVFDAVRVILVRLSHRRPIFSADKNHIHHKLMACGLSQHATLAIILSLAVLFIATNTALLGYISATSIIITDVIMWILFHAVVNRFMKKK